MIRTACTVAFALTCLTTTARADDCGPLKQINSIDLVKPNPGRALIPVSINGIPKLFLLDTGGDVSSISGDVADQLQLPTRDTNGKMLDLYGHASTKYAVVEKFGVGRQMGDVHLTIMPDPNFGRGTRFVGIFAPDLMGRFDVEIDFGTYKLNYFSPYQCPGKVVYWPHNALAVLPITFQTPGFQNTRSGFIPYSYRGSHIIVPVTIDGKDFKADVNTGNVTSSMSAGTAKFLLGVTADSPGSVPVKNGNDSDPAHQSFIHTFPTLTFDTVTVTNPRFLVYPDLMGKRDPNNSTDTENRARRVDDNVGRDDISIGMDILRKLHLYIAFDESRIFISEASTPPKPGAPPADTTVANTSAQQ